MVFFPFRLLVLCPGWLYKQRRWTTILSGSMSTIRYEHEVVTVGVVSLILCYFIYINRHVNPLKVTAGN